MASDTNGSVPQWLAALGIRPGEYFCESKLKWERAMTARCFPPAARIYACLALATSGFQDEMAWKMVNGKRVPLTPDDVSSRTQTSRKHFREYMEELRLDGMADIKGSTKGHVVLYAWQRPLPPAPPEEIVPRAGTIFDGSGLDPEVISVLKHCKIKTDWSSLSPREREEVTNLANALRAAQNGLRDWAKQRGARDTYKEERNERLEREETHTQTEENVHPEQNGVCVPKPLHFDPGEGWEVFWSTYTKGHDYGINASQEKAKAWWFSNIKSRQQVAEIMEGLNWHIGSELWGRGVGVPYAIRFLSEHKYRERPPQKKEPSPPNGKSSQPAWIAEYRAAANGGGES